MALDAPLAQAAHPVPAVAAHSPLLAKAAGNGASSRAASAIVVVNCDDAGAGSLRAAAAVAVSGDTLDLSALACSSISLTSGAIALAVDHIFITGPADRTLSIDGNGSDRILSHEGSGTLAVSQLSMSGGNVSSLDYGTIARGGCVASGGAIALDHVSISNCVVHGYDHGTGGGVSGNTVTITDSQIENCSVSVAADRTGYADGGAVYSYGPLSITRSTISGNTATSVQGGAHGGALMAQSGLAQIVDSTVNGNAAIGRTYAPTPGSFGFSSGMGGALFSNYVTLTGSTLSGNTASNGGAIALTFGPPYSQIVNSTLSGNTALSKGGGLWIALTGITIVNSTITLNHATYGGGGIMPQHPVFAGIYDNLPRLQSSVVANNDSLYFSGDIQTELPGLTITGSHNLIRDSDLAVPPDTLNADPMLLPLADNGGMTNTHAPSAGSPLIDAGSNEANLAFDQRGSGFSRVVGAAPDIGSLEYAPTTDVIFGDGFD